MTVPGGVLFQDRPRIAPFRIGLNSPMTVQTQFQVTGTSLGNKGAPVGDLISVGIKLWECMAPSTTELTQEAHFNANPSNQLTIFRVADISQGTARQVGHWRNGAWPVC